MAKVKINPAQKKSDKKYLPKVPSGISGFDEITFGGLPQGRPVLVAGGPGCGKTLFAVEFLICGATLYNEPGLFVSFEEKTEDIIQNVTSLGFNLRELIAKKKIILDYVQIEKSEIEETGEYDLEGLFIRLGHAIDDIKAKRVVLDTIESLFSGLSNEAIVRSEIRRLFRFLKEKKVTAVITGEKGEKLLTRHGLEEYISDCVIFLDHRIHDQISTRRLRIIKYRGSTHGTNEYPFLIDENGISVLPITSTGLNYTASTERISSGIKELDRMLEGKGFYRGDTILVSGTAGTGKTSVSVSFAENVCKKGNKCLYLTFEESPQQIIRNMKSIGISLEPFIKKGLLTFHASRPNISGLEKHLFTMHKMIDFLNPDVVIIDPITNLTSVSEISDVNSLLLRLIDFLKQKNITTLFTALTTNTEYLERTELGISSLIDVWLLLRDIELNGERNRILYILKSRGIANSNQVREFLLTKNGIKLMKVYLGKLGVLTGSARFVQEMKEKDDERKRLEELQRKKRDIERKQQKIKAQIAALTDKYNEEKEELERMLHEDSKWSKEKTDDIIKMRHLRKNY